MINNNMIKELEDYMDSLKSEKQFKKKENLKKIEEVLNNLKKFNIKTEELKSKIEEFKIKTEEEISENTIHQDFFEINTQYDEMELFYQFTKKDKAAIIDPRSEYNKNRLKITETNNIIEEDLFED